MDKKTQIDEVLSLHGEKIVRFANSIIGKKLRTALQAEEVLDEIVRYVLENPNITANRTHDQLLYFFLWKARKIVLNRARDLRVHESHRQIELQLGQDRLASRDVEPSPTLKLHRLEKRISLLNCLDLLENQDQREALRLVRLEGLSIREASKKMARSTESVRNLVRRGFANLVIRFHTLGGRKYITTGETT